MALDFEKIKKLQQEVKDTLNVEEEHKKFNTYLFKNESEVEKLLQNELENAAEDKEDVLNVCVSGGRFTKDTNFALCIFIGYTTICTPCYIDKDNFSAELNWYLNTFASWLVERKLKVEFGKGININEDNTKIDYELHIKMQFD